MFISVCMVSNPVTDVEKEVCSVLLSAALMCCDTANCLRSTLQQLLVLCFKCAVTA